MCLRPVGRADSDQFEYRRLPAARIVMSANGCRMAKRRSRADRTARQLSGPWFAASTLPRSHDQRRLVDRVEDGWERRGINLARRRS